MCRYLRRQPLLRIWVLATVLFLTLKEWEVIPQVLWRKNSKSCLPKDSPSSRSISQHWLQFPWSYRVSADLKTVSLSLTQSVASITYKISNIEQSVDGLAARVAALEAGAASVSSGSGSARSWNVLGHCDGSTAATGSLGSHGPRSSDDNRNTRRRLDTSSSPADEHARSAALLRFPCEQYHTGIANWINTLWERSNTPAHNKLVTFHCKAGSVSARLVFETRGKCQDFVARFQDVGIPYEIDSPFCSVKTTITVRQSKSLEDREIGKQFAP